jgi:hypothetical protein
MKTIVAIVVFVVIAFAVATFAGTFEGEWRDGPDGSIYVYTGRLTVQVFPYSREAADTLKTMRQLGIKRIVVKGRTETWPGGQLYIKNGLENIAPAESELQKLPKPPIVTYAQILLDPERYVGRTVTMEGNFTYHNAERRSFDMKQDDNQVEVFYEDLPRSEWQTIIAQKNFSEAKISVTGKLQRFTDRVNTYYLHADKVVVDH